LGALSVDGSFDEEAFLSDAGLGSGEERPFAGNASGGAALAGSGGAAPYAGNLVERTLTAFYRLTRLGWLADRLRGNAPACVVGWLLLVVAGVAHAVRHAGAGADAASAATLETFATVATYALVGTSEFVDVSYELAVGNVNIHVLTIVAAMGTAMIGCAIEGALLLNLFATAYFVEQRLTGHARGDLRSLWATVPSEAIVIDEFPEGGEPDASTERRVAARDVEVGTNVFVKSGTQVRAKRPERFSRAGPRDPPGRASAPALPDSGSRADADDDTFAEPS
jgi:hypothetical protein